MRVYIPTPLRSYTAASEVDGAGGTLAEVLANLDRRYPGLRFRIVDEQDRIRTHIRFFVGQEMARDLAQPVAPDDEIHIICALSGG
jgi:sulfur-carrier protein